jgi:glycosyltransferase involved in cell wall biosynthesis
MRICVIYDCLFPYTVGGGERWYRSVAERLGDAGHEVDYVTLRQWDRGSRAEIGGGVRVLTAGPRMSLYTASGRRKILPPLVFGAGVLWHLLRHGRRYDVVDTCAFPYFSLLAAAALRPLIGYELVVDWFEVWSDSYWREYLGPLGGRIGMLVQRLCARMPQRAFCLSELHARRLREEGLRGPVTVLRGLLEGRPAAAEPVAAAPRVMFAGRLIPEKRVELAVEAIALARERVPQLEGVIFGDGPEREALARAVERRGLEGVVSTPGFAPGEAVEAEMRASACMLLTSRREGYGLVVVEAAAHGTPSVVVAGEDNAATELIVEGVNGTVAADDDPRTVAAAIERVIGAGIELRRSTASWYAENAERLSLEHSLELVLASYGTRDGRPGGAP